MTTFQASLKPYLLFEITVLRGRDISKGKVADIIDTPDPYVRLRIPSTPSGKAQTKIVNNSKNPEWNEKFSFYLDPNKENVLEITLMEYDLVSDDILDTHTFRINDLEVDVLCQQTFKFGETSKVDVEMKLSQCPDTGDLRFGQDLCPDEVEFVANRKQFVFEAMKELLGDKGPTDISEVPTIALLGSGGGFRAMTSMSGVMCALKDTRILDCVTYIAGLSGSAWYISSLYSHPDWPEVHPQAVREELRENLKENMVWQLVKPKWIYKHMQLINKKKKNGQPVSFTDVFGYLVGETIIKGRQPPKLSMQKAKIKEALVPLPLYTCVNVKKDVSAHVFCEWLEFSPYETGFAKYGTFMKTELFGCKYFGGRILKRFDEPELSYLQGIWGSAFTILLQQVVRDGLQEPVEVKDVEIKGDVREQMEDMVASVDIGKYNKTSDESDEDSGTHDSNGQNRNSTHEPKKGQNRNSLHEKKNGSNRSSMHEKKNGSNRSSMHEKKNGRSGDDNEDSNSLAPEGDNDNGDADKFIEIVDKVINKFEVFRTRQGRAGLVHNFLRGLQIAEALDQIDNVENELVTETKQIFLVDSGLVLNSPYPVLLRPQRGVELYLSFDFSARNKDDEEPFKELRLAEDWARKNNYPFPPIDDVEQLKRDGAKECYVFRDPTDPTCPIVVHFVLINKTFMEYSKPGVPRSDEEKPEADFSIFENPKKYYSTFNFHYPYEAFDKITKLMEFNTLLNEDLIKNVIAECVQRKKESLIEPKPKKDKCTIL